MVLPSLSATKNLAQILLCHLPQGALLLLAGDLGVGKTTLTQQIGLALGATATISSPTYTLIHEYPTPKGLLVHIDAYRLPSATILIDLGLDDYLIRARLVVIEWGEALVDLYSDSWVLKMSILVGVRQANLYHQQQLITLTE